jgi:hypothetical protein
MKKAHQMGDRIAVGVSKGHAVSLRRTVAHGGQELKRCEEGVNANAFPSESFEAGLLRGCDVLEVAAHEPNNRPRYVGVRLRLHQEG